MPATVDLDLEQIAAFIDRRLTRAERNRVVRMLAESEDAFEIYTDALWARADLENAKVIPIRVVEERRHRPWLVAVPAAAAAAVLIAVMPRIQARRERAWLETPVATIARPVLMARTNVQTLVGEHDWKVTRGGAAALVESTTVFRLGVRAADLHIALAGGERDHAGTVTADMIDLLTPIRFSDGVRGEYVVVKSRIDSSYATQDIIVVSDSAERELRDFLDSYWFDVGKWVGAGEIAARARAEGFFTSSNTARFAAWASGSGQLARTDVDLVRRAIPRSGKPVSEADFETSRQAFAELIRRHAE